MLKPLVPKLRSGLSVRLRDIAEKQVPAKLKPIVHSLAELLKLRTLLNDFVYLLLTSIDFETLVESRMPCCKEIYLAIL